MSGAVRLFASIVGLGCVLFVAAAFLLPRLFAVWALLLLAFLALALYAGRTRRARRARELFFGAFSLLPREGYDRDVWERRVAELQRAQDMLWERHATRHDRAALLAGAPQRETP